MDIGYFCSQENKLLKLFSILTKKKQDTFLSITKNQLYWTGQSGFNSESWINTNKKGFVKPGNSRRWVQSGPISNGACVIRVRTKKMTEPGHPHLPFPALDPHTHPPQKEQVSHFLLPFSVETCSQKNWFNTCPWRSLKPQHSHRL